MTTRIAYLVNQYPKVSHTFIRREIAALEALGFEVARFAIRGWDADLRDPLDSAERQQTRYALERGLLPLLLAMLPAALRSPARFWRALHLTWRMARLSKRSLARHLVYLAEACWLAPLLLRGAATHLHAHFGTNPADVAMLSSLLSGVPCSFTVHGPEEFDRPQALGLDLKIEAARFVVAISSFGRSQLWRWAKAANWSKVHVVHCALGADYLELPPQPPATARRLVCVGRLCEQKGQLLLLQALHRYRERSGTAFELVLAGDGEMRQEIEATIAKLQLGDLVRITGWLSGADVKAELLAARALVLPSFAEGLPVVIMEAMALGRPVISTWVAGIPELVRDGQEGWMVPAGSVEALVDAIHDCLEAPLLRLIEIGQAARRRVLERHDAGVEAAKLAALFTGRPQAATQV